MSETLREMMATIKADVGNIHGKLDRIDTTIHGNGDDGLKIKVDRNTQYRRAKRRHISTIIAVIAVASTIILGIIQYVKEYHP